MKMKKGVCRFLSFIVSIVMVVSFLVCDVKDIHAGTDFTVTVSGTMGQTEARSMLAMINEFRHSSDAWYWNPDKAGAHYSPTLLPASPHRVPEDKDIHWYSA